MAEHHILFTNYSDGQLYTLASQATADGAFVGWVRAKWSATEQDFFRELSASLRFPSYFGFNWNAADECLADLEWLRFSRLLLIFDDFPAMFGQEEGNGKQECLDLVMKRLRFADEYWTAQGVPFQALVNRLSPVPSRQ